MQQGDKEQHAAHTTQSAERQYPSDNVCHMTRDDLDLHLSLSNHGSNEAMFLCYFTHSPSGAPLCIACRRQIDDHSRTSAAVPQLGIVVRPSVEQEAPPSGKQQQSPSPASQLSDQESAARAAILKDEAGGWEGVLNYYRKVAREYNAAIEAQYKPLFAALLKQVDSTFAKAP